MAFAFRVVWSFIFLLQRTRIWHSVHGCLATLASGVEEIFNIKTISCKQDAKLNNKVMIRSETLICYSGCRWKDFLTVIAVQAVTRKRLITTVVQAIKIIQAGAQTTFDLFLTFKTARKQLHCAQSSLAQKLIA